MEIICHVSNYNQTELEKKNIIFVAPGNDH